VVQAVTRTARFPAESVAAAPAAEVSLAAAPLAEEPLAAAPLAEEPLAAAPLAEEPLTAAPLAGPPLAQTRPVVVPDPPRPREVRLPIFESVESDWFRARRRPPRRSAVPADPPAEARSWASPGDDGWRAAETVLAPAVGGVTASGLPRRTPRANLVPGSAGPRTATTVRPADSAEAMSSRLAGFQRGSRRARAGTSGAPPPDGQQ
jgi:hypothetical protein